MRQEEQEMTHCAVFGQELSEGKFFHRVRSKVPPLPNRGERSVVV